MTKMVVSNYYNIYIVFMIFWQIVEVNDIDQPICVEFLSQCGDVNFSEA
jgi:hypothetical protein